MNKLLFVVLGFCFLAGCTSMVVLVHPDTKERVTCAPTMALPRNTIAAVMRYTDVEGCAKQYEGLGFVRAENLTPEQRAKIRSRPLPAQVEQDITITVKEEQPKK